MSRVELFTNRILPKGRSTRSSVIEVPDGLESCYEIQVEQTSQEASQVRITLYSVDADERYAALETFYVNGTGVARSKAINAPRVALAADCLNGIVRLTAAIFDAPVSRAPENLTLLPSSVVYINPLTKQIDTLQAPDSPGHYLGTGASGDFGFHELGASSPGATHSHVYNEIPTGTIDNVNKIFQLSKTPVPAESLQLFRNGLLLSAGEDYTLSVSTIDFVRAPTSCSNVRATYQTL